VDDFVARTATGSNPTSVSTRKKRPKRFVTIEILPRAETVEDELSVPP
jgi:hypothetical protein